MVRLRYHVYCEKCDLMKSKRRADEAGSFSPRRTSTTEWIARIGASSTRACTRRPRVTAPLGSKRHDRNTESGFDPADDRFGARRFQRDLRRQAALVKGIEDVLPASRAALVDDERLIGQILQAHAPFSDAPEYRVRVQHWASAQRDAVTCGR